MSSQEKENEDPVKKRKRLDKKAAHQMLQKEQSELRNANRQQQRQIVALVDQVQQLTENGMLRRMEHDHDTSDGDEPPIKKKKGTRSAPADKVVTRAGKQFAVCKLLWLTPVAFDFFDPEKEPLEDDPNLDDLDLTDIRAQAALLREAIPEKWHGEVSDTDFQSLWLKGLGKCLFDISAVDFDVPDVRAAMPECQELLTHNAFLYDDNMHADGNPIAGHLWHPCVLKAAQALLTGRSSAITGHPSKKTHATNGALWDMTSVTHEILSYVATTLYYILTGAPEFADNNRQYDFLRFYRTHLTILNKHKASKAKHDSYQQLMKHFNSKLFPTHHTDENENSVDRMGSEERALLEALDEDHDDDLPPNEPGSGVQSSLDPARDRQEQQDDDGAS